jgi:hypothetical protein
MIPALTFVLTFMAFSFLFVQVGWTRHPMTRSEFPLLGSPELVHFLAAQESMNQSVTNEPALTFVLTFMAFSFLGR